MEEQVNNGFVAYEYRTVNVNQEFAPLYSDCYKNLGWIRLEQDEPGGTVTKPYIKPGYTPLKFKRDRKIRTIAKIDELQRECEQALASIERLEKSKKSRPTMNALIIGLAGTCFALGAVFSYQDKLILLCVILGIIGFAGWGAAYPLYNNEFSKVAAQAAPLIDEQYERLYQACEQANRLLT